MNLPKASRHYPTPPERLMAMRLLTPGQALFWGLATAVLAGLFIADWRATLLYVNAILIAFYLFVTLYKMVVIVASVRRGATVSVTREDLAALSEEDLPTYTILVPLYREAEVFERLIQGLSQLDYPHDKLQILLLLEEGDEETIAACKRLRPQAPFQSLVVREAYPQTKPKACDVALEHATGEYLVIYDAEDQPEPDQLRKAVAAFAKCPPEVVCLQAKLNFYNPGQNILTKWFTAEYSMWYDLYLPGLGYFDAPIPLGGTSNHFRRETLMELGGWDPFNVAEDCDLGIRLYRRGFRTRMLDSTTWEEACSSPRFWVKQRSRWIKGYMQTFFVHTRDPLRTLRRLGPIKAMHFFLLTGGAILTYLINPFYWLLTAAWVLFRTEAVGRFFPAPVFIMGFLCLFLGNFVLVYANMLGCCRRGMHHLVKYVLAIAPYWLGMSVAAWKAAFQLVFRPHYWEKTQHGLGQDGATQEAIAQARSSLGDEK